MSKTIEIVVIDKRGYELERSEHETVKRAKDRARYILTDEWASGCETTHEDLGTHKAEVRVNGECVWDEFYESAHATG